MAKHGGGYLIFDIRGKTAETIDYRSAIALTETEIATLETAIAEKLPILYVGPTLTGDYQFSEVETAAFTHTESDGGVINVDIPMIGYTGNCCLVEEIDGVTYLITASV